MMLRRSVLAPRSLRLYSAQYRLYRQYFNLRLCPSPHSPQAPVVVVVAEAAAREAGGQAADATNG
jgi:hypothetical protein